MKVDTGPSIELLAYLKQIRQQQQKPKESNNPKASAPAEMDKVNLSGRAREVQQASQALHEMPEVRDAKVARIKMEVETGSYRVSGNQVATHMLRESLENDLILQKA